MAQHTLVHTTVYVLPENERYTRTYTRTQVRYISIQAFSCT